MINTSHMMNISILWVSNMNIVQQVVAIFTILYVLGIIKTKEYK